MSLKNSLTEAMKEAMRAKDKPRLGAIRLVLAEVKRVEVDERITVSDERLVSILDKMVKQRRDSISQYQTAGRSELAEVESYEISVIQEFVVALSRVRVTNAALLLASVPGHAYRGCGDLGS